MANATIKKKAVETVEGVTLELTAREAGFLRHVLGCIAGMAFYKERPDSPGFNTGPGYLIFEALRKAGVESSEDIKEAYAVFNFKGEK